MKNLDNGTKTAIEKLGTLGVLNSPQYWITLLEQEVRIEELLVKAASVAKGGGTRPASVSLAVDELTRAGVIDSPAYWREQTGTVGDLLKALAGSVAKKETTTPASEMQLRQKVCDIINGWVGSTRGDAKHLEILQIYNDHKPLARGYRVQVGDAHCATTVSATFIKAGISEYTGTECGVEKFVQVAKTKGIWTENDAYIPQIGDAIVYDWQDGSDYKDRDNTGAGDHIGIVTAVDRGMGTFVVTEGNMDGGRVGKRNMQVNGRYIRGFITPKYGEIAQRFTGTITTQTGYTIYTVATGDSLWSIAQKKLGDGNRWKEIQNLNSMNSPIIYTGQILKLPV